MMPDATQSSHLSAGAGTVTQAGEIDAGRVDACREGGPELMEPSAIVGSQFTFEQICAFGLAMGWGDRPLSFVVKNWMDSRPPFDINDIIGLPRG